jgi:FixJ family two-component response regulator
MSDSHPLVHFVDDDEQVREGISGLLRSLGFAVRQFSSASQFLAEGMPEGPGCIILDLQLPDIDGVELQQMIADADVPLPIIFLTAYGDIPTTVRAIKAGAIEFLTKPVDEAELGRVVRQAIAQSIDAVRARAAMAGLAARYATLTQREREVMHWVTLGRLNKQIAGELGTTEATVKLHRGNMMRKMGVRSVADLVLVEQQLGLGRK